MTDTKAVNPKERGAMPHVEVEGVVVYEISGPLFFGAAHRAISNLEDLDRSFHTLALDMTQVKMIDMTGLVALESLLADLRAHQVQVVLCGLCDSVLRRFSAAGLEEDGTFLRFAPSLELGLTSKLAPPKTEV